MNSHIYNLQERTECNKVEPKLKLWVINYEITDIAKGAALVKANSAKEASDVLLADSQFNAYRKIFNIIRIEEVITDGMGTNLAVEEWIRFSDIPNLDASKIIYIPSNGMNSRNVQGAIDELNTNIKDINIIEGPVGPKGEKGDKMTYDDLSEEEKNDLASRVEVDVPEIPEDILDKMIAAEPAEGDSEEVEDYVLMKSDIEHIIPHVVNQTDSIATIQPNVLNVWGEVASLDITIAEPTDNTIVNEYMVQFTSGATATTLILPSTIKWMAAPNIQPNKTYQLSVINNLGIIGEFSYE